MRWESRTVEDQRKEFAQAATCCTNFSALCREHGITRRGVKVCGRPDSAQYIQHFCPHSSSVTALRRRHLPPGGRYGRCRASAITGFFDTLKKPAVRPVLVKQ